MSIDTFLLSADTTDLNYPEVRPTLDLNFARVKALDPRITFTRASGGTYVGFDGLIKYAGVNEARFDHDPETGESLGLLIEESRENLLTWSENFSDSSWIKGAVSIVSSGGVSTPDGSTNTSKLVENVGNLQHALYKNRTGSNETVTFSIFCKEAERSRVILQLSNFLNNACHAIFDLKLGRILAIFVPAGDYTNISANIIPYPNGWYRCSITATKGSLNTRNNPTITVTNSNNNFTYPGDGTSGIYIWGAQLEQGSFPTSYIPTQTSTRTRAADSASITGKNFSEWYRQDEGTIYCQYKNLSLDTSNIRGVWGLIDSISIPRSGIRSPQSGSLRIRLQFNDNFSPPNSNLFLINLNYRKSVVAYNKFENRLMMDGSPNFVSALHTNNNNLTTMSIGCRDSFGISFLCGHISRLTYFPKRLPNSQLISLTS